MIFGYKEKVMSKYTRNYSLIAARMAKFRGDEEIKRNEILTQSVIALGNSLQKERHSLASKASFLAIIVAGLSATATYFLDKAPPLVTNCLSFKTISVAVLYMFIFSSVFSLLISFIYIIYVFVGNNPFRLIPLFFSRKQRGKFHNNIENEKEILFKIVDNYSAGQKDSVSLSDNVSQSIGAVKNEIANIYRMKKWFTYACGAITSAIILLIIAFYFLFCYNLF